MPTPLDTFFARFAPQFQYDVLQPATSEFRRLIASNNWDAQRERRVREDFKNALVRQFNASFGRDECSLTGWQALCEVIGVERVPESVSEAKKVMGTKPRVFGTIAALRRYTLQEDDLKIFSKKRAKGSGLLKYLLRPILCG